MVENFFVNKFISYKSVLVIEKNMAIATQIKSILSSKIKHLDIESSISNVTNIKNYDLIIIDIDNYNLIGLSSLSLKIKSTTSIMYLTSDISENLLEFTNSNKIKNILSKENQLEDLYIYVYLILKEKSKYDLGKNFYYCLEKDLLLNNNFEIPLTSLEHRFLKLLIVNKNRIVKYDEIEQNVWHDKKYSIFTMRNIVKKLRDKIHKRVIHNISNRGYKINNNEE